MAGRPPSLAVCSDCALVQSHLSVTLKHNRLRVRVWVCNRSDAVETSTSTSTSGPTSPSSAQLVQERRPKVGRKEGRTRSEGEREGRGRRFGLRRGEWTDRWRCPVGRVGINSLFASRPLFLPEAAQVRQAALVVSSRAHFSTF